MSKIARIYQGLEEIQKYYQGGVLQRLFFDWKHYIGNELNIEYAKECAGRNVVISGKTYQNLFKAELSQGHVNSSLTAQQNLRVNSEGFNLSAKKFTISVSAGFEVLVYPNYVNSTSVYVLWANKIVWNNNSESNNIRIMVKKTDNSEITVDEVIGKVILLEGDYTNIDLPKSINGIESVGKREFIKSKNLFDKNAIIQGKYQNFNKATTNFNITDNANYCISGFIKIKPQANYIFSKQGGAASHEGGAFYDKNKKPIVTEFISGKVSSITSPESAYYMVLNFFKTKINTIIDTIQIEEGTTATEYEPFYEYYPVTIRNYNYKCKTDGIVLPNGVKNSIDTIDGKKIHVQRVEKIIVTKQKDATKFGTISNTYGHKLYYINSNIYGEKGKCDNAEIGVISNKFIGIADDEWRSYEKVNCCFMNINGVVHFLVDKTEFPSQETFNDWLEKNEVTVYYPLAEPIYTYLESGLYGDITIPTSGIKNEIYLENRKWYHKRNIGKVVFDGSDDEEWQYYARDDWFRFHTKLPSAKMYDIRTPVYAEGYYFSSTENKDKMIFLSGVEGVSKVYVYNYDYTSVDDFKAYLAENPLEVYYELAEPVITELYYNDITYKLNEPLRNLPNGTCDTIEEGKIMRNVGILTVDENTIIERATGLDNSKTERYLIYADDIKVNSELKLPLLCDVFVTNISSSDDYTVAYIHNTQKQIHIRKLITDTTFNNVDELRALLLGHSFYYELETPIETEITPDMILTNGEPITDTVGIELPNGTKDSIENNYYVKRVEKIIFDENIKHYQTLMIVNNNVIIRTRKFSMAIGDGNIISNVTVISWMHNKNNLEEVTETKIMAISSVSGWNEANIIIPSSYFEGDITIEVVKEFLAKNPVTMYYELMAPIKIPLFSIKEGLTTLKSTNNITPQMELDCLVRNDFQNMCDNKWESGNINNSTGNNQDMGGRIRLVNYIYVKPNTKYRLDIVNKVNGNYIGIRYYDSSKVYISYKSIGNIKSSTFTFTIPENCYYIRFIAETTDVNFKIYLKEVIN